MHTPGIPVSGDEHRLMNRALDEARLAANEGEIPVGAIVVGPAGELLATARNAIQHHADPSGHAEIIAIRAAAQRLGDRYLTGCTLVVTLEPCTMCAGVIREARLTRVLFGAWDEKAGAGGSLYDILRDGRLPHPPVEVVAGVAERESRELLEAFFAGVRSNRPRRARPHG